MTRALVDMTGETFGRLTVQHRANGVGKKPTWVCLCTCGRTTTVRGDNLRGGYQFSCGCSRSNASPPPPVVEPPQQFNADALAMALRIPLARG